MSRTRNCDSGHTNDSQVDEVKPDRIPQDQLDSQPDEQMIAEGCPNVSKVIAGRITMKQFDFALAIGGAGGDGIATLGNIRRGLYLYVYNAYQSIIRGGPIFSPCVPATSRSTATGISWSCWSA